MILGDKVLIIEECCLYISRNAGDTVPEMVTYRFNDRGYTRHIHNNSVHIYLPRDSKVPRDITGADKRVVLTPDDCEDVTDFLAFYATVIQGFDTTIEYLATIPGNVVYILKNAGKLTKGAVSGLVSNV